MKKFVPEIERFSTTLNRDCNSMVGPRDWNLSETKFSGADQLTQTRNDKSRKKNKKAINNLNWNLPRVSYETVRLCSSSDNYMQLEPADLESHRLCDVE